MISIIVPIFNSERWLGRCIESLISQTYKDIEIILINDGSTDNSLVICKEYSLKDNRIVVIDKENGGVSSARNLGIKSAKGEYIQFVDSDDFIDPQMCEKLVEAIKNADMVLCGLKVWQEGRLLREPHLKSEIVDYRQDISKYFELRKINLGPCNKLYIREKITRLFDESLALGEDTLFVLDYMNNINIVSVLSDCLYNVVLDNADSLNHKPKVDKIDSLIEQRKYEENFLISVYGESCDLTEMHNTYLFLIHASLWEFINFSKDVYKSNVYKFLRNIDLQNRVKKSKPERIDYKIFKFLFIHKLTMLMYAFFTLKKLLIK